MLGLLRFCSALRFGAVLLALYFSAVSASYALGMSVFSLTSLAQLLTDIPTGLFADRVGRKPAVVLSAAVALTFTVCYALALNYWFLAAGAVLEGVSRALVSGADTALLHDWLTDVGLEDRYARYLGRICAAETVAFAVAALAGGVIVARWSFHLAFWLTLLPQSIALVASLFLREPRAAPSHAVHGGVSLRQTFRVFASNPRLRLLVSAAAWREGLGEPAFQFRVIFFQQLWPTWALGIAQTVTNLTAALSFYFSDSLLARLGPLRVLLTDTLLGRALTLPALLMATFLSPVLISLTSLTYGASEVALGTLQQHEFSDRERATMGSIVSEVINLAFAIGAIAIGLLADHLGIVRTLVITQVLLLGSGLLYLLIAKAR